MTDNDDQAIPSLAPAQSPRIVQIGGFVLIFFASTAILYYVWTAKKTPSLIDTIQTQSQQEVEATQADAIDALSRGALTPPPDTDDTYISLEGLDLPDEPMPSEAELERQARLEARRVSPAAAFPAGRHTSTATQAPPNAPQDDTPILAALRELEATEAQLAAPTAPQTLQVPELRNAPAQARYLGKLTYTILEGTTLPIILETPINTNLAGRLRGFVNRPVYSSDAQTLLIPIHTRVYGEYLADASGGAKRIFVIWSRLITPTGIEIHLDSPGADSMGRAGLGAKRDMRFFERFGASLLLSIIGGFAQHETDDSRQQYYLSESFNNAATVALQHSLNVQPILKTPAGLQAHAFVNRDLDFAAAYRQMHARRRPPAFALRKTVYAPLPTTPPPTVIDRSTTLAPLTVTTERTIDTTEAIDPACTTVSLRRRAMLSAHVSDYFLRCGYSAVGWHLGEPGRYSDYQIIHNTDIPLPNGPPDFTAWLRHHFGIDARDAGNGHITFHDKYTD